MDDFQPFFGDNFGRLFSMYHFNIDIEHYWVTRYSTMIFEYDFLPSTLV